MNVAERWAWVEPGVVLDELNAALQAARPALRARHLDRQPRHHRRHDRQQLERRALGALRQDDRPRPRARVVLSDGTSRISVRSTRRSSTRPARAKTLEARVLSRRAATARSACRTRSIGGFPKVLRRVGGYNLDEFVDPARPFNLAKLIVGSEGTLGLVRRGEDQSGAAARGQGGADDRVRRAARRARGDAARCCAHGPSAVEVMDGSSSITPARARRSTRCGAASCDGDPGALLCVEFYGDRADDLPPRLEALERDLAAPRLSAAAGAARSTPADQARIWSLREAALGLSMAMKGDAKSLSFVEDTAVAPEKLRDYIERFLADRPATTARSPASTRTRRSAACTCVRS